jgi:hypothetical protein
MDHPVPVDGCSLRYSIEVRAGNKNKTKIFRLLIFTTEKTNHFDIKITETIMARALVVLCQDNLDYFLHLQLHY